MNLRIPPVQRQQSGLAYVEALIAVLLLGVCLAPALQALGSSMTSRTTMSATGRDAECIRHTLEKTLTEPYANLLAAATSTYSSATGTFQNRTTYSQAPDALCPSWRDVYILRYAPNLTDPFASTSDDMLYVRAEIANAAGLATLTIKK